MSDRTFSSTEGECIPDTKHLGIVDDRFRYACDAAVVEVDARNHVGENARNNFEKNEKIKWAAQHVPVLMRLRAMITAASRLFSPSCLHGDDCNAVHLSFYSNGWRSSRWQF